MIATFLRTSLLLDTRGAKVEEKLGMFMFMLSHNASSVYLQYEFKHSSIVPSSFHGVLNHLAYKVTIFLLLSVSLRYFMLICYAFFFNSVVVPLLCSHRKI
uniref:DUF8040 domain-containing protein n=1 Tax=Arundo donax TaxID=35708 RepID=A0A0A9HG13_ARUDO